MKQGGYQIIDLNDVNITTGSSVTIKGIYNILKEVKKPLLLSGITVNGTKQLDQFIIPEITTNNNFLIHITLYDTKSSPVGTVEPNDTISFLV